MVAIAKNPAGQVTVLANRSSAGAAIAVYTYTYDVAANRRQCLISGGWCYTWTYDATNQLIADYLTVVPDPSLNYRNTYTYDPVGNQTRQLLLDGGIATTVYDPANQKVKELNPGGPPLTYTFDAAGNLASARLLPGLLAVTGVWDGEFRPASFSVYYGTPLGGPTNLSTSFVYNGDGQMVQKTDTAGVTRKFVWDAQNILQKTDLADATQVEYTLKPQLYGDLISHRRGSASRYYHCDAQGSVNALTDGAQSVQDIYVYDAWGNPVLAWENTENNFRYVGRQGYYRYTLGDPILFYQVRARHYAPNQWLSRDPVRLDGASAFSYVHNAPIALVDPAGLWQMAFTAGQGLGISEPSDPTRDFSCGGRFSFSWNAPNDDGNVFAQQVDSAGSFGFETSDGFVYSIDWTERFVEIWTHTDTGQVTDYHLLGPNKPSKCLEDLTGQTFSAKGNKLFFGTSCVDTWTLAVNVRFTNYNGGYTSGPALALNSYYASNNQFAITQATLHSTITLFQPTCQSMRYQLYPMNATNIGEVVFPPEQRVGMGVDSDQWNTTWVTGRSTTLPSYQKTDYR